MSLQASKLRVLDEAWRACDSCSLREGATQVVPGEAYGATEGPCLLVVGEAPGASEDTEGRPFVGQSGQVLREEILAPAGVQRAYIVNAVSCRPDGNTDPSSVQISTCSFWISNAIDILVPSAVLFVGRTAGGLVLEALAPLPKAEIVHPASLLRQGHPCRETREKVEKAVNKVRRLLKKARFPAEEDACEHEAEVCGKWSSGVPLAVCVRCYRIVEVPGGE